MERIRLGCQDKSENERRECNNGEGCCIYELRVRENYCDKGGHKERSLVVQPNHRKHWKKVEDE